MARTIFLLNQNEVLNKYIFLRYIIHQRVRFKKKEKEKNRGKEGHEMIIFADAMHLHRDQTNNYINKWCVEMRILPCTLMHHEQHLKQFKRASLYTQMWTLTRCLI